MNVAKTLSITAIGVVSSVLVDALIAPHNAAAFTILGGGFTPPSRFGNLNVQINRTTTISSIPAGLPGLPVTFNTSRSFNIPLSARTVSPFAVVPISFTPPVIRPFSPPPLLSLLTVPSPYFLFPQQVWAAGLPIDRRFMYPYRPYFGPPFGFNPRLVWAYNTPFSNYQLSIQTSTSVIFRPF